jgi:phosphate:Na+ symporter
VAAVGVLLIDQLAALAVALPGGESLPRQIANAHVAFNVVGVAVFLPFIAPIARFLERLLPDDVEAQHSAAA